MRRFLLISLVPLVVACSGPTASTPAPATGIGPAGAVSAPKAPAQPASGNPEPKHVAPAQPVTKTESKPAADAKPQAQASTKPAASALPKATIAPTTENHGIDLGQPIKVGANLAGLLVTNTTDQVMTFEIKIEFRKGDAVSEM